ncbi:hypothetical protein JCM8097_003375 [Rhodosporidiobolus ruineniae]
MAAGSFSFPPRGGRPQPQRTSSGRGAASPYSRPSSSSSTPSEGKWQHDLFGTDSNLYTPSINTDALKSKLRGWADPSPSASLRPFGAATPAAQSIRAVAVQAQQQQHPVQQQQQARPQNSAATPAQAAPGELLATRLGIKGSSDQVAQQRREREAALRAKKEREEQLKLREQQKKERDVKVKVAQEEEMGFVVQVEGLVQGTSAEDVQTAFGSYGDIRYCFILDPSSANLIARLTFTKHDDAAEACSKLDGAIADGRPLRVKQVSRTPMPPPLPKLPPVASSAAAASAPPTGPKAQQGLPTGPKGRRGPKQPVAVVQAPPPIPSKMYADEIEAAQTAALSGSSSAAAMDVDMADFTPSAPRGRGRGGRSAAAPAAPPQPPSLAQRLGGGAAGAPKGPAAQRGQQQQQGQKGQQQQGNTLAARLGVSNGSGAQPAAGGAGGGKGKKGKGAQAQGGSSLLARLG